MICKNCKSELRNIGYIDTRLIYLCRGKDCGKSLLIEQEELFDKADEFQEEDLEKQERLRESLNDLPF